MKHGDALLTLLFRYYEGLGKPGGTEMKWDTSAAGYAGDRNLLGDNKNYKEKQKL
jgi:hypothetical protein